MIVGSLSRSQYTCRVVCGCRKLNLTKERSVMLKLSFGNCGDTHFSLNQAMGEGASVSLERRHQMNERKEKCLC